VLLSQKSATLEFQVNRDYLVDAVRFGCLKQMRRRGYNQKSILQTERERNAFIIVPRQGPLKTKKFVHIAKKKKVCISMCIDLNG